MRGGSVSTRSRLIVASCRVLPAPTMMPKTVVKTIRIRARTRAERAGDGRRRRGPAQPRRPFSDKADGDQAQGFLFGPPLPASEAFAASILKDFQKVHIKPQPRLGMRVEVSVGELTAGPVCLTGCLLGPFLRPWLGPCFASRVRRLDAGEAGRDRRLPTQRSATLCLCLSRAVPGCLLLAQNDNQRITVGHQIGQFGDHVRASVRGTRSLYRYNGERQVSE